MRPATAAKFCTSGETLFTDGHSVWATRVEAAATWRVNKAGYLATGREVDNAFVAISSETTRVRCGGEQQLRIGMLGLLDHLVTWTSFNHLTSVHY